MNAGKDEQNVVCLSIHLESPTLYRFVLRTMDDEGTKDPICVRDSEEKKTSGERRFGNV